MRPPGVQAKAALFYLVKYITKSKTDLQVSLAVLSAAFREINANPSCAEDTGTAQRIAQHFITRAENNITGSHELADPQAANMLVGGKAEMKTAPNRYIYPWPAIAYVREEMRRLDEEEQEGSDE